MRPSLSGCDQAMVGRLWPETLIGAGSRVLGVKLLDVLRMLGTSAAPSGERAYVCERSEQSPRDLLSGHNRAMLRCARPKPEKIRQSTIKVGVGTRCGPARVSPQFVTELRKLVVHLERVTGTPKPEGTPGQQQELRTTLSHTGIGAVSPSDAHKAHAGAVTVRRGRTQSGPTRELDSTDCCAHGTSRLGAH